MLTGNTTLEGLLCGRGTLTVIKVDDKGELITKTYTNDSDSPQPICVGVGIGEIMQWIASPDSTLVFYEMCFPPYTDERFENLSAEEIKRLGLED